MKDIQITQEQRNTAERYVELFEQLQIIHKQSRPIFDFLQSQFVPSYGNKKQNSREAIKNKVLAEIILEQDTGDIEVKNIINKNISDKS